MTYLGLRPGEKLYEELLVKTEELDKTPNSMIFIERDAPLCEHDIKVLGVEQVLMQEETILDEEIILEIQRMAENWLQRIINKLHTHVTDFRTNPAVFLGGGSLLLRKQIENSPEFKYG